MATNALQQYRVHPITLHHDADPERAQLHMSFLTFPVHGNYQSLAPGGVIRGNVKFTSNVVPGVPPHGVTDGVTYGMLPEAVYANINGGILIPNSSFATSVTLTSNDPQLNLAGDLQYTVSFSQVTCDGHPITIDPFTFGAPADSTPVDLVAESPGGALIPISGVPSITVAGLSDATPFARGFLLDADNAVDARIYLGIGDLNLAAAKEPDLLVTGAVTVDSSDLVTSAAVVWPDGKPGTLTITSRDGLGAVLGYNITYGSPVTKTYTQPTITRNTNGAATYVPAIVVT